MSNFGNSLRITLCMYVKHNEVSSFRGKTLSQSTITKTNKGYSANYEVTVYPYIDIDFTSYDDKKELTDLGSTYVNNSCRITLNKYNLYLFITMIKKIERDFIVNKDLYYYSNNKLMLNTQKAQEISVDTIINDIRILISPIVIEVGGGGKEHEGISLAFRDLSNVTQLTYTEMGYLRYILDNVDLDLMAINLLSTVGENKISTVVHNTVISNDNPNVIKELADILDKYPEMENQNLDKLRRIHSLI